MSHRQAKFCLDRNNVRWILLEGVITRTAQNDDPTAGKTLKVEQINRIEKSSVQRIHRSPLARPAIYGGIVLLALFGWLATAHWGTAIPGLIVGAAALIWGLARMGGQKEKLDSFQIVAAGTNPTEWLIVGSHHEVIGFIEGVQLDMQEIEREKAAAPSKN